MGVFNFIQTRRARLLEHNSYTYGEIIWRCDEAITDLNEALHMASVGKNSSLTISERDWLVHVMTQLKSFTEEIRTRYIDEP